MAASLLPSASACGGELGVHGRGLVVLAVDGLLEIGGGVAELAGEDELILGVAHLVDGGLLEDLGDVVVALLAGHLGEVGVHVARLALAGERGHQVLLGLGHGCLPLTQSPTWAMGEWLEISELVVRRS